MLATLSWRALSRGLGPEPARVDHDFAGFTWRVRSRSPVFQLVLSTIVELSTEVVLATWLWGLTVGWGQATAGRWVLGSWGVVQLAVMALAIAWDVGARTRLRQVRVTPHSIRLGPREQIPTSSITAVRVGGSGWGPLHRAQLEVHHHSGRITVAADGDEASSLQSIASSIEQLVPTLRRATGHVTPLPS